MNHTHTTDTTPARHNSHWLLLPGLAFVMLATRMDHFGSAVTLPDASLAVFFFAGFALHRPLWAGRAAFLALCGLAAAIDFWAIDSQGVSSFCVTPAYGFLLPTYFAMWWAGRQSAQLPLHTGAGWLRLALLAGCGVSAAFVISNGSFYLFSGYVTAPALADYAAGVARYFPRYAFYCLGYIALGLILRALLGAIVRRAPSLTGQSQHD
ncbi:MAG: hypothetical protein VR73_09950 [Gammaproteobacteria bacterium BRH_c0]|nr:MAG: hypothetical protein VR73_09950 [Gammaproteobacteria bacterium BRH_c0]